jgi:hypothetical protein
LADPQIHAMVLAGSPFTNFGRSSLLSYPFSFSSQGSEGDDLVRSLEAKLEQCRLELAKEKVCDARVC